MSLTNKEKKRLAKFVKKIIASKKAAMKWLVRIGQITKDGKLTKKYGGK